MIKNASYSVHHNVTLNKYKMDTMTYRILKPDEKLTSRHQKYHNQGIKKTKSLMAMSICSVIYMIVSYIEHFHCLK